MDSNIDMRMRTTSPRITSTLPVGRTINQKTGTWQCQYLADHAALLHTWDETQSLWRRLPCPKIVDTMTPSTWSLSDFLICANKWKPPIWRWVPLQPSPTPGSRAGERGQVMHHAKQIARADRSMIHIGPTCRGAFVECFHRWEAYHLERASTGGLCWPPRGLLAWGRALPRPALHLPKAWLHSPHSVGALACIGWEIWRTTTPQNLPQMFDHIQANSRLQAHQLCYIYKKIFKRYQRYSSKTIEQWLVPFTKRPDIWATSAQTCNLQKNPALWKHCAHVEAAVGAISGSAADLQCLFGHGPRRINGESNGLCQPLVSSGQGRQPMLNAERRGSLLSFRRLRLALPLRLKSVIIILRSAGLRRCCLKLLQKLIWMKDSLSGFSASLAREHPCTLLGILSGLHQVEPYTRRRLQKSWKLCPIWQRCEIPRRAPPLTRDIRLAMAGSCVNESELAIGALILLGFQLPVAQRRILQILHCDFLLGPLEGLLKTKCDNPWSLHARTCT